MDQNLDDVVPPEQIEYLRRLKKKLNTRGLTLRIVLPQPPALFSVANLEVEIVPLRAPNPRQ